MKSRTVRTGSLRTMNCEVRILGVDIAVADLDIAMDQASALADYWNQLFSRFLPESTLCRLNAAKGEWMVVDHTFLDVLTAAVDTAHASGGVFDPSILPALEHAGYDCSFELIGDRPATLGMPPSFSSPGWTNIEINRTASTVRLNGGTRIDLGGIAKGAYVDEIASYLREWPGGFVEAGGDLAVWGVPPTDAAWRVGVENPFEPSLDIATLSLSGYRAIATSGTKRRCWTVDHEPRHHLIDPRTGIPVSTSIVSVSTVASTVIQAEVGAKVMLIGEGFRKTGLPDGCVTAVIVDDLGNVHTIDREVHHALAS